MSFAVRLSSDLVSVEAGATMPLTIEVVNRAEEADRFELEIEGLDPEWTAVPVPTFLVGPGDTASEKVFFRVPRTPESLAGNYPFVAKVRSLASGEQRTAQGVLQIKPYHHISAEISPKKGMIATFRKKNVFTLTLVNLSNTEHTLQLSGSDPEDDLAFDFETDQVTISPGQQTEVRVTVQPTRSNFWRMSNRLSGFTLTARSIEGSTFASAQAQLEQLPVVSPASLVFGLLCGTVLWAWWYARPRPPGLDLGVSQSQITLGQPVTVFWRMNDADKVHIEANGESVWDGLESSGKVNYTPTNGGVIEIVGVASKGDKTAEQRVTFTVVIPPAAPLPKILSFSANPTNVRVGDSTIFSYKLNDAVTSAIISPLNQVLNLNDDQIRIPITQEGDQTFTLIAENRDNKVDKKTIKIKGFQQSAVKIISFTAEPKEMTNPGGMVTVSWQLTDAVHVEVTPNPMPTSELDPLKGKFDVLIDKTTVFTLTAKDKDNLPVTATAKVIVNPPPTSDTATGGISASPP